MEKYAGLWIDHKEAVVVILSGDKVGTKVVKSNVEGHFHLKGGSGSKTHYGPQAGPSDNKREDRYKGHLQKYYQRVIKLVEPAESVLILGPGEAKNELKKEMQKDKELSAKIAAVETVDRMTKTEIEVKTKKYFKPKMRLIA